jgi:4-hydroxy-tetrahydrodipicolinate synthase
MAKQLPYTRKEAKDWAKKNVVDWYECPLTPMTQDLTFDEAGMRENLEAYIEMGETGLVIGGFLSECWNVKLSDWKRYHEIMADAAKGRIPLWTIILDPSVHQALEKMQFVQELGYVGAEVINPVVQLRSDQEIYDYFKYMTDHSDLAIFLYRTAVSGKLMSLELIQKLADLDTVVGVKQGSLNHIDTLTLRKRVRDDFIVSDPDEYWWLDDLRKGGQVIWAHFIHAVYGKKRTVLEEYTKLARQGKYEEAYTLWESLEPVRDLLNEVFIGTLVSTASYATATGYIKAWHEAMGLKAGPMLPPVRNISPEKKEWLQGELKKVGVI